MNIHSPTDNVLLLSFYFQDEKPIGIFTDQHGFTSSELFSSSGPSNSRNYKFKGTPIVFNDEDDKDQGEDAYSSGDEYCILEPEKENQVLAKFHKISP